MNFVSDSQLTHNLRNIPRMTMVILILALFVFFASLGTEGQNVQGATDERDSEVAFEIEKTLKVIGDRPDYAGAWVRLSILYEEIGEMELAKTSYETAKELNPDL
jgi:hypothetical protein